VSDPPLARRAAITGCSAFVLAAVGFAIPYPGGGAISFFHGLAIITVPIAALVAVVSRAYAKERVAIEQTDDPAKKKAKWLTMRARPVVSTIVAASVLVGAGAPRIVIAVGGVSVLVVWLAWLQRTQVQ
jgi:hypothetical protein